MKYRLIILAFMILPGEALAVKYPGSFDAISKKCEKSGYTKLKEDEKLVYNIWWLEGEINNGGFDQFFRNNAGDHTYDTLRALKVIGANHTAEIFKKAIDVSFNGPAPTDRTKRQQLLEIDQNRKEESLDKLDREFYKYKDDIAGLVNQYLSLHKRN